MISDVFSLPGLVIVSFCIYVVAYAISVGGVFYVFTTEIVPAKVLMVPLVLQVVFTFLIGAFTLRFINLFGIYTLYVICGFFSFMGWFLFNGFAIETKCKENSQIIAEFKKKKFYETVDN